MTDTVQSVFDSPEAVALDERLGKMSPLRDALHLLIARVLSELPETAHVLCVGAGTGKELIDLAGMFPAWRFTAVEPAAAMLDVCRSRVEALDMASRFTFHHGYINTLKSSAPFDAALCLLVSHFMKDAVERSAFFESIGDRLGPGGYLVSADVSSGFAAAEFGQLSEVWGRLMKFAGMAMAGDRNSRAPAGFGPTVLPAQEVAAVIAAGGFSSPVLFFQALLMHAWFCKRIV